MANRDELHRYLLEARNIEPGCECRNCGGSGVAAYGSTATWRGGVGGQVITVDVCNSCWGSGNQHKPWPSHRIIEHVAINNAAKRRAL